MVNARYVVHERCRIVKFTHAIGVVQWQHLEQCDHSHPLFNNVSNWFRLPNSLFAIVK